MKPSGAVVKNPPANAGDTRDMGSIPGSGRSPSVRNGKPTPVFLPGKLHGQRSYSPWSCKESDATENRLVPDNGQTRDSALMQH